MCVVVVVFAVVLCGCCGGGCGGCCRWCAMPRSRCRARERSRSMACVLSERITLLAKAGWRGEDNNCFPCIACKCEVVHRVATLCAKISVQFRGHIRMSAPCLVKRHQMRPTPAHLWTDRLSVWRMSTS